MVGEIAPDDLKLQNVKGNTAFCLAVMAGNKSIAKKMELLEDEDANENELAMTEYEHGMDRFDTLASVGFNAVSSVGQNNRSAKYPDPRPLSTVPGAALEMQRELCIFKDVEKLVMPSFRGLKNSEGKTPRELFTSTHAGLQKDGEKWMRNTASQCLLVASIIATVVFQAAFTVPGGNNNLEGTPTHRVVDRTINVIHIYSNHDVSLHFKLLPGL
ncbi:hypothetical protein Pint_21649 [Pistacia integerrima]|uniref:Uncharacterized protein n=1 Tax=Pistacia integerrima TaxID=434235 RepID=A0ACC0XCA4_9ROSI|nr:hypothetical protein Pint_21649 [Pistacia integerrima]